MSADFQAITETPGRRRDFGALVRNTRVALFMDQHDLAIEAQCTIEDVRLVETGHGRAPGVMRRIAEVLSLQVSG